LPGGKSLSLLRQRKATPQLANELRPFGVPKISRQQQAARKLVARGCIYAKGDLLRSPLKQCERTAPSLAQNFGEAIWGIQKLAIWNFSCNASISN
jgi:hypothetical protein